MANSRTLQWKAPKVFSGGIIHKPIIGRWYSQARSGGGGGHSKLRAQFQRTLPLKTLEVFSVDLTA